MSNDQSEWKSKYSKLLEQLEQKEARAGEMISVMQRLVARVSLAAEGQNRSLDTDLKELRTLIRASGTTPRQLTQQLERIEKRVLELDGARNASIEVLGEVAQLVDRRSESSTTESKENMAGQAAERRSKPPGLFGRLLAGRSAKPELSSSTDLETVVSGNGLSAFGEHVQKTLLHLLSSMTLPDTAVRDLELARDKILAGVSDSELMLLLDEVAALVIAALGKGQRDFETFLKSLDDRLTGIHTFISDAHQHTLNP